MNRLTQRTLLLLLCGLAPSLSPSNAVAQLADNALDGAALFTACSGCHERTSGAPHRIGPNLYALAGRQAGSQEGFSYSPALAESGITWGAGSLTAWILAPEEMVPGTWMLYHNPLQPDEVSRLVSFLLDPP